MSEKQNFAIIGASYLQLPLIEKAKEMGYTTHVFAWAANDVGEVAADYFYPISIIEKEKILKKCREIGICGICSIASDLAAVTVNFVANELGLAGNSWDATLKSTNKHMMRLAFEQNGDPSPRSILVDKNDTLKKLDLKYPVIVKPTDRSGSRGVYKLDTPVGMEKAIEFAISESFEKKALVEEYVEGQEYSVECISYQGKHFFLAMTLKFTTGAPHFIETGHQQPASIDISTLERVKAVVFHGLDTLGIKNGASHSELKIMEDGSICLIEIGGRMGGDCIGSDLVRYSTGYDFVKMVIQVALGKEPDFSKVCEPISVKCVFMFKESDFEEYNKLKETEPERILKTVDYHPEKIGHTTDSSNRAGCYICKCE